MEFDLNKKHCYYFKQISDIPRGSRNEKEISDYIVNFARQHCLRYIQDEANNVIVYKPASPGYENAPAVILQAHTDMVCEKNKGTQHDFEKDPLDLYVDQDGWLCARGTTLGADDGQGVAYMLAILDDDCAKHPALECAFTSMEEIGLLGAKQLKKEYFTAKRYINLDAGGENQTSTTSSGGTRAIFSKKLDYETCSGNAYCIQIRGLLGGHSAGVIHMERGNSIHLAARTLEELSVRFPDIRIADFNGGLKFNAIPREADLSFVTDADEEELFKAAQEIFDAIYQELRYSDEGFSGKILSIEKPEKALSLKQTREILHFMYTMPNGFQHRSIPIEGLTVASLNTGVTYIEDGTLYINDLIRSALPSHTDLMIHQLQILSETFGFTCDFSNRYYGWDYTKDSEMREILRGVLKDKGIEMKETASHGGLECGVFKGLIPDLDIITYGPISSGAHTPDEKLDLASFDRAYDNLLSVLERCR